MVYKLMLQQIVLLLVFLCVDFVNGQQVVSTECGCADISPGEQHSCDQQKEWGKCMRSWMIDWDYCAITCGRCQCFGSEQCTDIPPNKYHTCAEQKDWGKCAEAWMKQGEYCETTCGRCEAANQAPKKPPLVIVQNRGTFSAQDSNAAVMQVVEVPQFETVAAELLPSNSQPAAIQTSPPNTQTQITAAEISELLVAASDYSPPNIEITPSPMLSPIPTPKSSPAPTSTPIPPSIIQTPSSTVSEETVVLNEQEEDDGKAPDYEQEIVPSLLDMSTLSFTSSPSPISPSSTPNTPTASPVSSPTPRVCECDDKPPGRSLTCAQQKALGKCMRGWMLSGDHCAITCGRCHCVDDGNGDQSITCTDNPPSKDYTCADQLRYGKCDENWIVSQGYCKYTCDRCDEPQQQGVVDAFAPSMLRTQEPPGSSFFSMQSQRQIQPQSAQDYNIPTPVITTLPSDATTNMGVRTTQNTVASQTLQTIQQRPLDITPIPQNILPTPQIVLADPELALIPDEIASSPETELEDDFSMTLISSSFSSLQQSQFNLQNQQPQYNPLGLLVEDYDAGLGQSQVQGQGQVQRQGYTNTNGQNGYTNTNGFNGYNPQTMSGYSGGYNPQIFSVPQGDNANIAADNFQIQYRQYTSECSGSINQEIAKRPFLSILSQLLPRTGLAMLIQNTIGGVTLFAPRDEAFRAFARENDITLQDLFVNPTFSEGILPKLIAYHIVPRKLSGRSLAIVTVSDTMLAGEDNLIFVKSADPLVIEGRASEAEVVEPDIIACDGIIHILDSVLLPVENVQLLVDDDDSNLGSGIVEPRLIAPPAPDSQIQVPVGVPVPAPSNQRSIDESPVPTSSVTNPQNVVLESRAPIIGQDEPEIVDSTTQKECRNVTVLDILENLPDTEILFRMVQEFGLERELESPVTFFAPIDDALEQLAIKLGFSSVDDLLLDENRFTVLNILFFHMIPQSIQIDDIDPNVPIPNINGSLLYLSKENSNGDIMVTIQEIGSQAKVIDADEEVNFGCDISLYLIDTALLPFTIIETTFPDMGDAPLFAPPPPPIPQVIPEQVLLTAPDGILEGLVPQDVIDQTRAGQRTGAFVVDKSNNDTSDGIKGGIGVGGASVRSSPRCPSILDVLRSRQDLTLMNALIMHAGLDPLLNDTNSEFTVLAPTDKAFQALVEKLGARSQSLTNHEVLGNILGYHVIRDAIEKDDFEIGLELPTLVAWLGNSLSLLIEENDLGIVTQDIAEEIIIVGIGSEAQILEWDIQACQSVVHIIDTVLLPVDTQ